MDLGTLALIAACGLAGPLLSQAARGKAPVVIGEILAGIVIGQTGFRAINPNNGTLTFLSNIGFLMLMFTAGMNVPLRDDRIRGALGEGLRGALTAAVLAVGAGELASHVGGVGHPGVYAVLIASGSAAVVLPIVQEGGLRGAPMLATIAWVTVADVGATLAVPIVLQPSRTGRAIEASALVAVTALAALLLARRLGPTTFVRDIRRRGRRRNWAVDLRVALVVLFFLGWIAQRTGASLLIAGFGAGLVVASLSGPKRLSTEVLGIGGGFFVPLFFVLLGARLDLRGVFQHPSLLALTGALAALNVAVHVIAARATRLPAAAGLVASAQLGVPSAVIAIGLPAHVITAAQGGAILLAALVSITVCSLGAPRLGAAAGSTQRAQAAR